MRYKAKKQLFICALVLQSLGVVPSNAQDIPCITNAPYVELESANGFETADVLLWPLHSTRDNPFPLRIQWSLQSQSFQVQNTNLHLGLPNVLLAWELQVKDVGTNPLAPWKLKERWPKSNPNEAPPCEALSLFPLQRHVFEVDHEFQPQSLHRIRVWIQSFQRRGTRAPRHSI